jgi:hypothetical protein
MGNTTVQLLSSAGSVFDMTRKRLYLTLVLAGLVAGCAHTFTLRDLEDERPFMRMRAAAYFGEQKSMEAAPYLARLLEDEDPSVRIFSHEALKEISGKDFGFDPVFEDKSSNKDSLERWRQWAQSAAAEEVSK